MNKTVLKYCFICLVLFGFVITANGEMYFWIDENGVKHYSNRTPPPEHLQDNIQSGEIKDSDDYYRKRGAELVLKKPQEYEEFLFRKYGNPYDDELRLNNEARDLNDRVNVRMINEEEGLFRHVFGNRFRYGQTLDPHASSFWEQTKLEHREDIESQLKGEIERRKKDIDARKEKHMKRMKAFDKYMLQNLQKNNNSTR